MREILFRGKGIHTGNWAEGNLNTFRANRNTTYTFISNKSAGSCEVIPETVGQFTGIYDKNEKRIFEGDIVKDNNGQKGYIAFLEQEAGWVIVWKKHDSRMGHRSRRCAYDYDCTLEIIGNIHDNPELWKGGE